MLTNRYKKNKYENKLYGIYCSMKYRCYNPKDSSYKNYGGKGIAVCNEWKNDFKTFVDWSYQNGYKEQIGVSRSERLSIDRIDVNGNYEPSNCRWITLSNNVKRATTGRIFSKTTREKIGKSHIGKKLTDEHKKKLSISHIGKGVNNKRAMKGYFQMIDSDTNEILKEFYGYKEIDNFFKKRVSSNVWLCASGKRNKAYGYKWKYILIGGGDI